MRTYEKSKPISIKPITFTPATWKNIYIIKTKYCKQFAYPNLSKWLYMRRIIEKGFVTISKFGVVI